MPDYVEELTDKSDDYSRWYTEVILKAQLADYAPVRGCMVIRPYGFALWENMVERLDRRIKETGVQNAYFPLLIPESLLAREAEHVEGFAPEVAWVTQGGDQPLEERLAIRPTSEAIIGAMYSRWIQSYRDLPVLINQWANVMRWEKVTRLFLRTTEFLWQEGHTVHRTAEEAQERTLQMLEVYTRFLEDDLAIPVIPGRKTESEKFAGALETYSVEAMMGDGKALQAGTSHNLGQHFARVFDIMYLDADGERKYAWQTSWGVSTRTVGAVIMVHGDDSGLILPPRVAPYQVVIVPIWRKEAERLAVFEAAAAAEQTLRAANVRVFVDWSEEHTPGWKFNEWELRGVPVRLEIGPRDVQKQQAIAVRRDDRSKEAVDLGMLAERIPVLLDEFQEGLLARARSFLLTNSHEAASFDELADIIGNRKGFAYAHWCTSAECEAAIKEETKATIRVIPRDLAPEPGRCVRCGRPSPGVVVFGRAY